MAEALIRRRVEDWAKAIRAKDIDQVLSLYAPNIVSFDLDPPHGDLAIVHSLNHVSGTLAGGRTSDLWVRWTACFRRIEGVWLVVHDHVSPGGPRARPSRLESRTLNASRQVGE